MTKSPKFVAWVILFYLTLIWGASYLLMDIGLKEFDPFELGGLRLVTAALVLLPFAIRGFREMNATQWLGIIGIGVIGTAIPAFLFPMAMAHLNSTTAGILNCLSPLFTLIVGATIFGFGFNRNKLWGVLIGFAGASLLVILSGSGSKMTGGSDIDIYTKLMAAGLVIFATLCYGTSVNIMKKFFNKANPIHVSALAILVASIPYAIYIFGFSDAGASILNGNIAMTDSLKSVLVLGVFGTALALALFNKLVQMTDPIFSASVTYLMPIVVIALGFYHGDNIGIEHIVGLLVILGGVYLVSRKDNNSKQTR